MAYISPYQKNYLKFIKNNPGVSTADVNRACKVNPQAGHMWVYDGVKRLIRRGMLCRGELRDGSRGKFGLYINKVI